MFDELPEYSDSEWKAMNEGCVVVYGACIKAFKDFKDKLPDTPNLAMVEHTVMMSTVTNLMIGTVAAYEGDKLLFVESLLDLVKRMIVSKMMGGFKNDQN